MGSFFSAFADVLGPSPIGANLRSPCGIGEPSHIGTFQFGERRKGNF